MSEDKLKKLIEAGITAEDIERELAKRAQAPKKKITKKLEPHNVSIEVKSIKPESIPDKKEDEFVQFLRNRETEQSKNIVDEYGSRGEYPAPRESKITMEHLTSIDDDYNMDDISDDEIDAEFVRRKLRVDVKKIKEIRNYNYIPELNRIFKSKDGLTITENRYNLIPLNIYDYQFLYRLGQGILDHLSETLTFPLKIGFVLKAKFVFIDSNKDISKYKEETFPEDRSIMKTVLSREDLNKVVEKSFEEIIHAIGEKSGADKSGGSGWDYDTALTLYIKQTPIILQGGSYKDLPKWVEKKKCCVNVQNKDEKCFLWAVLSCLHPTSENDHNPGRISNYEQYMNELKVDKLTFPLKINQIKKFEKLNEIPINVLEFYDNRTYAPVYISHLKDPKKPVIHLGLYEDHYVWIKNFSR